MIPNDCGKDAPVVVAGFSLRFPWKSHGGRRLEPAATVASRVRHHLGIGLAGVCLLQQVACGGPTTAWEYRGVCYDANWEDQTAWYGTPKAETALRHLRSIGVNAVSFTPFAYQPDVNKPDMRFRPVFDPGLETDMRTARSLGMKVVLKPHIWSHQFSGGNALWYGSIEMRSDEDWRRWFDNYERMICQFAVEAERLTCDLFVIGTEYEGTTRAHADEWRCIAEAVRKVYHGPITYAAHGTTEADAISFWDALDFIGVNAYFPLSNSLNPTEAELQAAWKRWAGQLAALSQRNGGKRVILTEAGYPSVDGSAQKPFLWAPRDSKPDVLEQADCYDAMFTVLKDSPWLAGMFLWKFKIGVTQPAASHEPSEFFYVFQDKPAEGIIKKHFLGG